MNHRDFVEAIQKRPVRPITLMDWSQHLAEQIGPMMDIAEREAELAHDFMLGMDWK